MVKTKASSNNIKVNLPQKHSLKSSISQSLQKWRTAFKRITHEALVSLDEASTTTDDKVNALFHNGDSDASLNSTISSTSRTVPTSSANLNARVELRLTDETDSLDGVTDEESYDGSSSTDGDTDSNEPVTYETYDARARCKKLRQELGDPFWQADIIWKERRDLWVQQAGDQSGINDSRNNRKTFKKIPIDYYPRIYKKLAIDDKPLREPLNLEDALQVINSGWTETKKWSNLAR